jgi:hypothetical protein
MFPGIVGAVSTAAQDEKRSRKRGGDGNDGPGNGEDWRIR